MDEHNIRFIERTFGELEKGIVPNVKDPYRIMASLGPNMREALLHNPSGYKDDEICQILALDGDKVVGTINPFSGRLRINEETVQVQNGSYLYAHEDYRKDNVGGELFLKLTNLHPTKNNFYSGISNMALPIYRALKYTIFEFPRLIYLRRSRSAVQAFLHSESWWTIPLIWLADFVLWFHRNLISQITKLRFVDYKVEEVQEVPQDIERIVMEDNHPFMELHDKSWFEWNLTNSFSEEGRTKRRLYVIRHKGSVDGFFLLKQEFFKQASSRGFKNVYLGSIMEWGISKISRLKEKDIVLLSLTCFDNGIDGVQYASTNQKAISQLKKLFFVQVGRSNMGFKIRTIKDDKIKDVRNWRIRLAAGDTLID